MKKRLLKIAFHNGKGAVVQLVRIPACHAGGRGFESRPHRKATQVEWLFLCPITMHFVYILYSKNFDSFYVGYTKQPDVRLEQHNLDRYFHYLNFL